MDSRYTLLLLCLVGVASSMNLISRKQEKTVLYFQAQEKTGAVNEISSTGQMSNTSNSTCPDRKHFCVQSQTCCRSNTSFACCPQPEGVCCSDGKHCCSKGFKCDVRKRACYRQVDNSIGDFLQSNWNLMGQVELLDHGVETTEEVSGEDVKCKDGSSCPNGSTCCEMSGGRYGCCPLPQAVCCSDHTHCCPSGYTCDVSAGTCQKGSDIITWLTKQPAKPKVEDVKCKDGSSCPDGSTCCEMSGGRYGCCPLPEAVCCSDHTHCCPAGYTCDVSAGTCQKGSDVIAWLTKQPAKPKVEDVRCNDGSSCPDGSTCCEMSGGRYGCCPLSQAVCCSDHIHCCPSGYTCDVSAGTCTKGSDVMGWFSKQPAEFVREDPGDFVVCPGGQSQCPDGTTCCRMKSGEYGCCPYPRAVCCSDGLHCCPASYKCEISAGTCQKGNNVLPWLTKLPAKPKVESVKCKDGSACPDGSTCCEMSGGRYGCCPLPQAVCCSDHTHCCPSGYTCDVSAGTCQKGSDVITWLTKQPAKPQVESVKCKDGSACPDGSTCCEMSGGRYGCCPLPQAVCCSDHTHCCPSGYTCDVSAGTCQKGSDVITWLTKQPAKPQVESVKCKDGSACPDGSTCCEMSGGRYGCCPLPQAVCCSDHTHCCPTGYTCDVSAGTCQKGSDVIAWLTKQPAKPKVEDVKCNDGSSCPDGSTCCEMSGGRYGCCPLPQAVCCSDHTHCCPTGYTCDVSAGTCQKGSDVIVWLTKQPAKPKAESVKCKDGSACPDGSTCCEMSGGRYGCCPLPQAVCCSDHTHCCPTGYTCDVSAGTCQKGSDIITWLTKQPAKPKVEDVKCNDGSSCPDGSTCCEMSGGRYGCCPLPQAVCCSDHTHCCPTGYTCDVSAGTCLKGSDVITWLTKQPSKVIVKSVQCDDSYSCPDGSTCCKRDNGEYACCPLPNAVCCSDHTHCCPGGYKCDVSGGTCQKGDHIYFWLTKLAASKP